MCSARSRLSPGDWIGGWLNGGYGLEVGDWVLLWRDRKPSFSLETCAYFLRTIKTRGPSLPLPIRELRFLSQSLPRVEKGQISWPPCISSEPHNLRVSVLGCSRCAQVPCGPYVITTRGAGAGSTHAAGCSVSNEWTALWSRDSVFP